MARGKRPAKQPAPQPSMFVRFTGMKAAGDFDETPGLGDRWTFTVTAACNKELHRELMTDGHFREVVGMKIIDVQPGRITPKPKDPQLALVNDDGQVSDDDGEEDDDADDTDDASGGEG